MYLICLCTCSLLGVQLAGQPIPTSADPLGGLEARLNRLLRSQGLAPDVRPMLEAMHEDVATLLKARQESSARVPEDYQALLARYSADLDALPFDAMGTEEFDHFAFIAADLRAKAAFARYGTRTICLRLQKSPIYHLSLSPSGEHITVAGTDGVLQSRDVGSGRLVWKAHLPEFPSTTSLASGPLNNLYAGGQDGTIVHVASPGKEVNRFKVWDGKRAADIRSIAVSHTGRTLAVGTDNGLLDVWDVDANQRVARFYESPGRVFSTGFSPDGNWICSVAGGKEINIRDTANKVDRKVLKTDRGLVARVRFLPDNRQLVAASPDGRITVWDWREPKIIASWQSKPSREHSRVWDTAVSPDGRLLAVAGGSRDSFGEVTLWDLKSRKQVNRFRYDSSVYAVALDGRADRLTLATGHHNGTLRLCSLTAAGGRDPFAKIPIKINTVNAKGKVDGYRVWWDYDSRRLSKPAPFQKLSSPTQEPLYAGTYLIWATRDKITTKKIKFTFDVMNNDADLEVP